MALRKNCDDIVGKTFGNIFIMGEAEPKITAHASITQVHCKCLVCGSIFLREATRVRDGRVTSHQGCNPSLYSYPETIDDELINVVKSNDKICSYFDLPIQHISNNILKKMNRKSDHESICNLIKKLRKEIPGVVLRTTLIVGFPGETEEDFKELCDFVKESKFNRLGAFAYSREDGTPAAKFNNQIDEKIKNKRKDIIMKIQQDISKELLKEEIGKVYEVLIENISEDGNYYIGRSYKDVPSEDGVIYIKNNDIIMINEFVNVRIIDSMEYDLIGEIVN